MKLIRTVDAAGQVLCHDITQIIPGEYKDARFRKGHVIQPEDIPVLLSIGKENLYVWEKHPGILHEDEAAALLYKAAAGKNIHGTAPKEGKIELIADCDGLLKINRKALMAVNSTPQMMIATIHGDLPVKKGQKLAGTRIIPLVIEQEKMDAMQAAAGAEPILNVLPMQAKKGASSPPAARCSRDASRINLPPSCKASWRSTAARWFFTRSAMMTPPGSLPPFWRPRPQGAS